MNIETIRQSGLIPPGSRVLCAVSGGADSMALLHLLWSEREALKIQVCAAHFEHGLRGEEALRDAAFVEAWCAQRRIVCRVGHGNMARQGLHDEDSARQLRYAFLEKAAQELGCDRIVTAHNAEDNAETLLLNLCRGAGLTGLSGIPPQRGKIVRPLLAVRREAIRAYLAENGIEHVEDSSNAGDAYSRNLLRHQVLPILEQINPAFADAAGRTATLLRRDAAYLNSQAEAFRQKYFDGESLPVGELNKADPAISSRVVKELWKSSLNQEHVESVLKFAGKSGLGFLDLPGGRLRREQGRLYFVPCPSPAALPERLLVPGQTLELPEAGLRIRSEFTVYHQEIHGLFKTYSLKYANIYGNIFCTGRRNGDKLRPAGRNCTKSLKSLLMEAGLTQAQRDTLPVLRDEAGPLLAYGLAADERTVPAEGDRVLRLCFEEI